MKYYWAGDCYSLRISSICSINVYFVIGEVIVSAMLPAIVVEFEDAEVIASAVIIKLVFLMVRIAPNFAFVVIYFVEMVDSAAFAATVVVIVPNLNELSHLCQGI
jgi:hypothetical protein